MLTYRSPVAATDLRVGRGVAAGANDANSSFLESISTLSFRPFFTSPLKHPTRCDRYIRHGPAGGPSGRANARRAGMTWPMSRRGLLRVLAAAPGVVPL